MYCPECEENDKDVECERETAVSGGGGGPIGEQRWVSEPEYDVEQYTCPECNWESEWECYDREDYAPCRCRDRCMC